MKRQHVRYCFTELPYHYHKTSDDLCLKSGQFTVTNRTDTVLHFRIANLTTAYLTIAFDISDANGGADEEKSQKLSYRSVIDGSRPAQRIAVANGLIFDFITICNRPYYGLMCAHYCAYAAGDHHICDSSGKKVCLLGWTGKDCAIATGDVLNTRIDDITTPSPTKASSSKSTAARLASKYMTTILKPRLDDSKTTPTRPSKTMSFVRLHTRARPYVRRGSTPTLSIYTVDDFTSPTHSILQTFSITTVSSTASSPTSFSSNDRVSTLLTTSPTITNYAIGCYTASKMRQDDSADSSLYAALLLMTLFTTTGFLVRKFMRSSRMQNLLNSCRAKISFIANIHTLKRHKVAEKTSKMFVVDLKGLSEAPAFHDNKNLRYSLQPSGEPARSGKQLFMNDTSMTESNTYHEIDSFLVSPTTKRRLATFV